MPLTSPRTCSSHRPSRTPTSHAGAHCRAPASAGCSLRRMSRRAWASVVLAIAAAASGAPAVAAPEPQPQGQNDAGGVRNVLPPGANGFSSGPQLALFLATGARPPHNDDQLGMYKDLL